MIASKQDGFSHLKGADKKMATYSSKITIETREIHIIKYRRSFLRAYCLQCQREVGMISPRDAALLSGKDLNTIDMLMQTEQFHWGSFDEGKSFICINSLCLI
jgi:hypothetical protein